MTENGRKKVLGTSSNKYDKGLTSRQRGWHVQRPCSGQVGSALVIKRGLLFRAERAGGGQKEEKGQER